MTIDLIQQRKNIKADIECLIKEIEQKKNELKEIEENCQHVWGATVYDPVVHEVYTIPECKPGYQGQWYGEIRVPKRIDKRWKRECTKCGRVEITEKSQVLPPKDEAVF